jgi:hypothetical protein
MSHRDARRTEMRVDVTRPCTYHFRRVTLFCMEGTMWRERALKIVLVLVGLLFTAGVYPLIGSLLHPADSDTGDTMMLSLYVTLGVFLLIAVRNPSAHRSVIAFAAWSSFAHAVAMSILGLEIPNQKVGFLVGSAVLVVIGVTLSALNPAKPSVEQVPAAAL